MTSTRNWLIGIALIIVLLVVGAFSFSTSPKGPVKIGVLTPLSGPVAIAGEVQKNAISMAMDDLRASGINIDNYEIIYEDSKYDPKTSLSGYEALKLKGVKIIIADGSPVVAAIREKAVQDKILVFAQSATTPAFTDESPFTCRVGLTATVIGPRISTFAKTKGVKKLAILTSNNEYGQTMKDEIVKSFEGEVVAVEIYDQASGDLRSNILKLTRIKNNIDALVVINNITPEPMFKQLEALGWNKPILSDIWTITSPNMTDTKVAKSVNFVDYQYSPQVDLNTRANAKAYATEYAKRYQKPPILLGALTYDSLHILVQGIKKVGSDPEKLAAELSAMSVYKGVIGDIKFDSSCQNVDKELLWRKVKADGTFANI